MKLADIILLILFAISVAIAIWYLFGSTPTFEQAILVLIAKDFKEHIQYK